MLYKTLREKEKLLVGGYCFTNVLISLFTKNQHKRISVSVKFSLFQGHNSTFHDELENVMSLMPIASSPRDNDVTTLQQNTYIKQNSPIHELVTSDRDNIMVTEESGTGIKEPVKLLGEDDDIMFPMTEEIDLEQIESH